MAIINDTTNVEVKTELLDEEILKAFLRDLQVVYLQSISWLLGYPMITAKNDLSRDDNRTIEELKTEIEELKLKWDEDLKDEIDNLSKILAEKDNLEKLAKEKSKIENNISEIETKIEYFKNLL